MTDKEKALEEAKGITGPCTCHEGFTCRELLDPSCAWHNYGPKIATLALRWKADGVAQADDGFMDDYVIELRAAADEIERKHG